MNRKICLQCGTIFVQNSNIQKFCSQKCYREAYKKYKRKYDKKYRISYELKNKKKISKCKKRYYQSNKFNISKKHKKYYKTHKEERKKYDKIHKERLNKYRKLLKLKNPSFRILCNLRTRINQVLKGINKSKSTIKLLGCSLEFLKQHLEKQFKPGMSWKNYGRGWNNKKEWQIDHIKPCASFDLSVPEQQKLCFNYTNLQPLWAEENLSKGKHE